MGSSMTPKLYGSNKQHHIGILRDLILPLILFSYPLIVLINPLFHVYWTIPYIKYTRNNNIFIYAHITIQNTAGVLTINIQHFVR